MKAQQSRWQRLAAPVQRSALALWLVLAVTVATMVVHPQRAGAATGPDALGCHGSVRDDHWLQIDCSPGYATASDQILVYSRRPLDQTKPWSDLIDYTDAIWLFNPGGGATALAINFYLDNNQAVADIYDDVDRDGKVSYQITDGVFTSAERRPFNIWTMRVRSHYNTWVRNGMPVFDLDLEIDGQVKATFLHGLYLPTLSTNTIPDIFVHVRAQSGQGRPAREWRQVHAPALGPQDNFYRTSIMVNTEDDELPITGSLFWPFLDSRQWDMAATFEVKDYNASPPPIRVDWKQARITQLGEFVASRGNPGNYFVYTFKDLEPGKVTQTDHENPFAFYDVSGASDGYPDLLVRMETYHANDPFLANGRYRIPRVEVEYTWDQDHTHNFSYMVALLGRHAVDRVIELPEFSIEAVPFDEAPTWIMSKAWEAATFVAVEQLPYWTAEHIYEYTTRHGSEEFWRSYFPGRSDTAPVQDFDDIPVGLRGEFNLEFNKVPMLYFSPIDRKLHMMGTTGGVWNLGRGLKLYYDNLGGDFINEWRLEADGIELSRLAVLQNQAILRSPAGLRLRALQNTDPLFVAPPPTDSASWHSLRAKLEQQGPAESLTDPTQLFERLEGESYTLPGVVLSELRMTAEGFRGILDAAEDGVQGPWEGVLPRGKSFLEYRAGQGYQVTAYLPADVKVKSAALLDETVVTRTPATLRAVLGNEGRQDAKAVNVTLNVESPTGERLTVGRKIVDVAGDSSLEVIFEWTPKAVGQHRVSLLIGETPYENLLVTDVHSLESFAQELRSSVTPDASFEALRIGLIVAVVILICVLMAFATRVMMQDNVRSS